MSDDEEDIENSTRFKEFTLDCEKKLAKYIPPKIEFKSDLNNLFLVTTLDFNDSFLSSLKLFFGYYIINVKNSIFFYDKIYNLTFKFEIFKKEDKDNEILGTQIFEENNLIISATDKVRIEKFYEKEPNKITHETIQEICDTEFYFLNKILSNNYLLLSGLHKNYVFYQLENPTKNLAQTTNSKK